MSGGVAFEELVDRVRAGDQDAAAELVRRYEPQIRREVRIRLTDPGLRRTIDSMDICQSVLANFFARAALGQFQLEDPRQLLRLLVKMAHNRLNDLARYEHRQCRDQRLMRSLDADKERPTQPASREPSPSQVIAGAELLAEFRRRLSDDERLVADRRAAGIEWDEIAAEVGGTPGALRKRLERAMDRVAKELGLEEFRR
jgi:RNA polymerase sigma factor (sigma-70 family)